MLRGHDGGTGAASPQWRRTWSCRPQRFDGGGFDVCRAWSKSVSPAASPARPRRGSPALDLASTVSASEGFDGVLTRRPSHGRRNNHRSWKKKKAGQTLRKHICPAMLESRHRPVFMPPCIWQILSPTSSLSRNQLDRNDPHGKFHFPSSGNSASLIIRLSHFSCAGVAPCIAANGHRCRLQSSLMRLAWSPSTFNDKNGGFLFGRQDSARIGTCSSTCSWPPTRPVSGRGGAGW